MALERLTQITEVGIQSGITLRNVNVEGAFVSGVVTATTLNVTGGGANFAGVVTATSFSGNVTGNITPTGLVVSGVSTFQSSSFWGDGDIAYFGDGQDLLIFHNSTDSIIRDNGTGDLYIEGGNRIRLTNPTGIETYGVFNQDGAVELYHDNVKKFETSGIGVSVFGGVSASGVSTFSGGVIVAAGSAGAPSISPTGDSNTGIFFPDGDTVSIGEGGTEVVRVHSLGRVLVGTANTNIAGAPSNKGAKQFIYTTEGNGEWALQARHDSTTGNGLFIRAGNNSTTYTARFTGYDENNVHLNIDGLGRVTTPLQPAFIVNKTNSQTLTSSVDNVIVFDNEVIDIGGNYASNRFTAPVTGNYQFQVACMGSSGNGGYVRTGLKKNGGSYYGLTYATITIGGYESTVTSSVINLSANDYVEVVIYPSMSSFSMDNTGTFSGHLIG